jgi:hypothetical protein
MGIWGYGNLSTVPKICDMIWGPSSVIKHGWPSWELNGGFFSKPCCHLSVPEGKEKNMCVNGKNMQEWSGSQENGGYFRTHTYTNLFKDKSTLLFNASKAK